MTLAEQFFLKLPDRKLFFSWKHVNILKYMGKMFIKSHLALGCSLE